jgi:hypothetical protein
MGLTQSIPIPQALVGLLGVTDSMIAFQLAWAQRELARDRYVVSEEMGEEEGEIHDNNNQCYGSSPMFVTIRDMKSLQVFG